MLDILKGIYCNPKVRANIRKVFPLPVNFDIEELERVYEDSEGNRVVEAVIGKKGKTYTVTEKRNGKWCMPYEQVGLSVNKRVIVYKNICPTKAKKNTTMFLPINMKVNIDFTRMIEVRNENKYTVVADITLHLARVLPSIRCLEVDPYSNHMSFIITVNSKDELVNLEKNMFGYKKEFVML